MKCHLNKLFSLAVVAACMSASPIFAALPSYVFSTEFDGKTYLTKFDGTSTTFSSQGVWSGAGLQANRNSSGGGLSLLNGFNSIWITNPGTAAGGMDDVTDFHFANNTQWNLSPVGRHGVPASGNPSFGIFRATITGGVGSTPNINSPSAPFNQGIDPGIVMGDFAHDLFSGASNGHTYITSHNSDAYIDLGEFSLQVNKNVQAGNGAIVETLGGVWYIDPTGSMTQLSDPNTNTPFASLDNNEGGKVRGLGYFNADGKAWFYNSVTNTVAGESGLPIAEFVRVGSYALAQEADGVWLLDGTGGGTQYLVGANRLTSGLSFGDYALVVVDGVTLVLRDNGSGIDDAFWSGAAIDLTRATGGYLGVVNEAAALPGDFNEDNRVDVLDYVVWGMSGRDSGPYQYSDWSMNYGATADGNAVGSAVPEPTASLLVLAITVGGGFLRRRR